MSLGLGHCVLRYGRHRKAQIGREARKDLVLISGRCAALRRGVPQSNLGVCGCKDPESLLQEVWGGAREFAFQRNFQVLRALVQGPPLENHWHEVTFHRMGG